MTQVTAMFVMFILYGVLPVAGLYLGYRGIKKMTAPKIISYHRKQIHRKIIEVMG